MNSTELPSLPISLLHYYAGVSVAALFVEAVLYGVYAFLFACTVYVLVHKRSTSRISWPMLICTVILFLLGTMHLACAAARLVVAFRRSVIAPTQSGNGILYLLDQSHWLNVLKYSSLVAQIWVGDVLLIYRLYVAYNDSLRVILIPAILLLANGATSVGVAVELSRMPYPSSVTLLSNMPFMSFLWAEQALVLFNNILCTVLIALRLRSISRVLVVPAQKATLRAAMRIVLESGAITTVAWGLFTIMLIAKAPSMIISLESLAPITGISFSLLVCRVALASSSSSTAPSAPRRSTFKQSTPTRSGPTLDSCRADQFHPMRINITSRHSVRIEEAEEVERQERERESRWMSKKGWIGSFKIGGVWGSDSAA